MRSILNSRLGRASMTLAIAGLAGLAVLATSVSAEARPYRYWNGYQYVWVNSPNYWGPRYYNYAEPVYAPVYAPPGYYYPPAYYRSPGLTVTVPFG
jgi:hypothetical protein